MLIKVEPIQYNQQWYIVPKFLVDDFFHLADTKTLTEFNKKFSQYLTTSGLESAELWAKDKCVHQNYGE